MMRNTTLCTAMHEAGHAVAQLANPPAPWINSIAVVGLPDGLLGLVDTKSAWQPYMAATRASDEIIDGWRRLAWKDVLFYLAGPVAELRWRRHSRAGVALGAHHFAEQCLGASEPEPHTDLGRVRVRLKWAYPGEEHAAFVRAWLEAEEIIARRWGAVKVIGRLVNERGTLPGDDLLAKWKKLEK